MSAARPGRARLLAAGLATVLAGGLIVAPGAAWAQRTGVEAGAPSDRSGPAQTHVQLEGSAGDGSASVTLEIGNTPRNRVDNGTIYWSYDQTSLTVSTPFEGKTEPKPATLDGLSGTKATFRFGRFSGGSLSTVSADMMQYANEALAACRVKEAAQPLALEKCEKAISNGNQLWLIGEYMPEKGRRALRAQIPAASTEWGFEGSIAYQEYAFVDPATLVKGDSTKVEFSGKAFVAFYPVGAPLALTGAIEYQHSYKAQDDAVICPASVGGAPVTCTSAAPGAPKLDENLLLSGGLRLRISNGSNRLPPLAIAPLVTYDTIDGVFGVDVPVYLITDKDSGLIGGLRGGWRSDTKKVTFGVFVGSTFNLLN